MTTQHDNGESRVTREEFEELKRLVEEHDSAIKKLRRSIKAGFKQLLRMMGLWGDENDE